MADVNLSFYDFHRQHYAQVLLRAGTDGLGGVDGQFMIGDYADEGGVNEAGEFKLNAHLFQCAPNLSLQMCVFGDGVKAFEIAWALGLRELVQREDFMTREQVGQALVDIGIRDRSDKPLASVQT